MEYALGIDTSNYKTSVALVSSDDSIIYDRRILLDVPEGKLGLRQQEALFQHISNLPKLLEEAISLSKNGRIVSVAASNKPRPIDGSYMPCFLAGEKQCHIIASLLGCKENYFSHQEGHLSAARRFTELNGEDRFVFFHFSGGTTEILEYDHGKIRIVGSSSDISFGQLLDRVGNKLGFQFPAGEEIDKLALGFEDTESFHNELPKIKVNGTEFNLSGIESASMRLIGTRDNNQIAYMLMERILDCIKTIITNVKEDLGENTRFLFSGGVSSSTFIRKGFENMARNDIFFSDPRLASDNAVGIAFLGGDAFWQANR